MQHLNDRRIDFRERDIAMAIAIMPAKAIPGASDEMDAPMLQIRLSDSLELAHVSFYGFMGLI